MGICNASALPGRLKQRQERPWKLLVHQAVYTMEKQCRRPCLSGEGEGQHARWPSDLHTHGPTVAHTQNTLKVPSVLVETYDRQCSSSESFKITWEEAQSEKRAHIFWDLLGIQEMGSGSTSKALALIQEPHCKPIQIVVVFTNLLHFHVHVCVCTRVNVMWRECFTRLTEDCVLESVLSKWVLGVEFGSWGLAASPFSHRTILLAPPPLFLWSENSECNPGWPWQAILRIWGTIGRRPCGHLLCLSFVCLFVCLSFWSDKISWECLCGHMNVLHCHFPAQDYLSAQYSTHNLSLKKNYLHTIILTIFLPISLAYLINGIADGWRSTPQRCFTLVISSVSIFRGLGFPHTEVFI